jgi:hypothetical protein
VVSPILRYLGCWHGGWRPYADTALLREDESMVTDAAPSPVWFGIPMGLLLFNPVTNDGWRWGFCWQTQQSV